MATPELRYADLNKVVKGPQIFLGLRERILCAINLFMRIIDYRVKELDTRKFKMVRGGIEIEDFGPYHTNPSTNFYKHWNHYEQILSAGIYCLGLVKSKVKNFADMKDWTSLPHYYDGATPNAECYNMDTGGYQTFKALENPIKPAIHFKHQRTPTQTIVGFTNVEINSADVAWAMIYSLSYYGIEVNAGHKMASVGQILTLMSLFSERFKSCWYQDAGVNMNKNVKKEERGDDTKFRRFNLYGLNRNYYHHFRMLNYPKEIKARLRRMTGIGTDIIDYINVVKKGDDPFKEKEQIQGAMKRKLAFWNHNNNVADYLKYIQSNVNNDSALSQINATFIGVINARMPAIQYNIVLPAIFWFFLHDHKIFADFSSQSAYRGYQKLRELMEAQKVTMLTENDMSEVRYAILMSIFDLHQVDQNVIPFMFKIKAKTRADFSPKFVKGNTFRQIGKMPELVRWSKMYNGERGGGGEEQCSVLQAHAGQSSYQGDDMIVTKPDDVKFVETQQGGLQILQRLQSELNDQYKQKHKKVVTYGTQKWYEAVHVSKSNQELETVPGISFTSKKVQPFYVAAKGAKGLWKSGNYNGQLKRTSAQAIEAESDSGTDEETMDI